MATSISQQFAKITRSCLRKDLMLDLRPINVPNNYYFKDGNSPILIALRDNNIERILMGNCCTPEMLVAIKSKDFCMFLSLILTPELIIPFVEYIQSTKRLCSLYIGFHETCSEENITAVFAAIGDQGSLFAVEFKFAPIDLLDFISELIHVNQNLFYIQYSSEYHDFQSENLREALRQTRTLRHLILQNIYIESTDIWQILMSLKENESLVELNLLNCDLELEDIDDSGAIIQSLVNGMKVNRTLESLKLVCIHDAGEILDIMAAVVKQCPNLQNSNEIIDKHVPEEMNELQRAYQSNREIQATKNRVAKNLMLVCRNLILLSGHFPVELVTLIYQQQLPEGMILKESSLLRGLLLERDSLGICLPFKFSYLELLRFACNRVQMEEPKLKLIKEAIHSRYAPSFFKEFLDPQMDSLDFPDSSFEYYDGNINSEEETESDDF